MTHTEVPQYVKTLCIFHRYKQHGWAGILTQLYEEIDVNPVYCQDTAYKDHPSPSHLYKWSEEARSTGLH